MRKRIADVLQIGAMLIIVAALSLVGLVLALSASMATPRPPEVMAAAMQTGTLVGSVTVLLAVCASISQPSWRKAAAWMIALFGLFLAGLLLAFAVQQG